MSGAPRKRVPAHLSKRHATQMLLWMAVFRTSHHGSKKNPRNLKR